MDGFDVEGAIAFVSSFASAINMNIVDLYLPAASECIPAFWTSPELLAMPAPELVELASVLFTPNFSMPELPTELTAFLAQVRKFSLINHLRFENSSASKRAGRLNERKSDKKRHEIERLGELIDRAATSQDCLAVDFGAGQGYLSQSLADAGWQVVALERDDGQCHGSIVRQVGEHRPYKVVQVTIDADTDRSVLADIAGYGGHGDVCFCSLHACGSLSIDMLRLFLAEAQATILANVGCCYNLMREEDCPPLSQELAPFKEGLGFIKERSARMLACQAPWRWASRPAQSMQSFRSNHFRALFQAFVLPHLGLSSEPELGRIPASSLTDFCSYVVCACERLGRPIPQHLDLKDIESLHDESRTAAIWTMRALLGPVIESILLLDRYFWLSEGITGDCKLLPLFNPITSPRNFLLYAKRS